MPYTMEWLIPGRVIDQITFGDLTLDDVLNMRLDLVKVFLPEANPPFVHSLFNITDLTGLAFTVNEFLETPQKVTFTPEQQTLLSGWRVYYGNDDRMFRFVTSVFHQRGGHKVQWFPVRDEALDFLADIDPTLQG